MTKKRDSNTSLVPERGKSLQYEFDLFGERAENKSVLKKPYSNTFEQADIVPKFFFTHSVVEKHWKNKGYGKPFEHCYSVKDKERGILDYKITYKPAQIRQKDGSFKWCFPGKSEELVDETLKKLLTNQTYGLHVPEKNGGFQTWVEFSLNMVRTELEEVGKSRNVQQIKKSISVLRGCEIEVEVNGELRYGGNLLQEYIAIDRESYQSNASALGAVRFPTYVSSGIQQNLYRRYNFQTFMQHKGQLTRWIHKRLINKYTYASMSKDHHFRYSSLVMSGLLNAGRSHANRETVIKALNELVTSKVILDNYVAKPEVDERTGAITDVVYTVQCTPGFAEDQRTANSLKGKKLNQLRIGD